MGEQLVTLSRAELDELEQLARAATQDPWQWGHSGTTSPRDAAEWHASVILKSDNPDLWLSFIGNPEIDDGTKLVAVTGNGPTSEANSKYITALHPLYIYKLLHFLRQSLGVHERIVSTMDVRTEEESHG